MIRQILLSQLVAMIKVGYDANRITASGAAIWRDEDSPDEPYNLVLYWKNKIHCGQKDMSFCMTLDGKYKDYPVLHAYYFAGDNCNDHTRFLYEIIANEIQVLDDLGIVGGQISNRKSLTAIKPHEVYIAKLKAKSPELFGGK